MYALSWLYADLLEEFGNANEHSGRLFNDATIDYDANFVERCTGGRVWSRYGRRELQRGETTDHPELDSTEEFLSRRRPEPEAAEIKRLLLCISVLRSQGHAEKRCFLRLEVLYRARSKFLLWLKTEGVRRPVGGLTRILHEFR